jgi:pimeloyl-ACP methyl ester carboxylesterase
VSPLHHRQGRGAPLVLVHGIGGRGTVWAPILPALAARFEVLAVDLPGHGGGAAPGGTPTTVEGHAAALERWFGELDLGRPHVAGSSMGGGIALELARRGAVASATAISPVGFWTPRERTYARRSLLATRVLARRPAVLRAVDSAAFRRAALRQGFGRPERVPAAAVREILGALAASEAFDATLDAFERHAFARGDELRGTPVTVAWGTRDLLLLHGRQAPRARRMLPWARHADLTGCGHLPFWDDPALCAAVVAAGAGGGAA